MVKNRALPPRLLPVRVKPVCATNQRIAPVHQDDVGGGSISGDMLYGAEQIQIYLGLQKVKQVYYLVEKGDAPIGKMPGLGLVASKKALREWYSRYVPGLAS